MSLFETSHRLKDGREFVITDFDDSHDGLDVMGVVARLDGAEIGFAAYDRDNGFVRTVEVEKDFRRMGVATALYDYIENLGYDVKPSPAVEPDGWRFWEARRLNEGAISYPKFQGMGGLCGQAAIAINRVVFSNAGGLVGCFNRAFYDAGRLTGHVAVFKDGTYWDADASPKDKDDIESWAMLDLEDPDYAEFADEYSIDWNDDTANDVIWVEMTEAKVIEAFGSNKLEAMMRVLGATPVSKTI